MTKFRFFLAIIVGLVLFYLLIFFAGNYVLIYVDILSLVFAVIVPYIIISFVYTPSEQWRLSRAILSADQPDQTNKADCKRAIYYLASLKRLIIAATVASFLVGMIGLFALLDDTSYVAVNLAVALICVFYAALYIFLVIEPLRAAAQKKLAL